jgi:hypothetical protein
VFLLFWSDAECDAERGARLSGADVRLPAPQPIGYGGIGPMHDVGPGNGGGGMLLLLLRFTLLLLIVCCCCCCKGISHAMRVYARAIRRHNAARRERRLVSLAPGQVHLSLSLSLPPLHTQQQQQQQPQEPPPEPATSLCHALATAAALAEPRDAYRRADLAELYAIVAALCGQANEAQLEAAWRVGRPTLQRRLKSAALTHLERQYCLYAERVCGEQAATAQIGGGGGGGGGDGALAHVRGLVRVLAAQSSWPAAARQGPTMPVRVVVAVVVCRMIVKCWTF